MAKMGRPPIKNPKDSQIGVRLTNREKECLMRYASSHNMTITEVVASAITLFMERADVNSLSL